MKISPLAFNKIEYGRNVLILGELPEAPLSSYKNVGEFWKKQVKSAPKLSRVYKVLELDASMVSEFNKVDKNDLFDEFVRKFIKDEEESKKTLIIARNMDSWESVDLLEALLSSGRRASITILMEPADLNDLSESTIDAILANTACIVFGRMKDETKKFLEDGNYFSSVDEFGRVLDLKDDYWAIYFADVNRELGRKGLYIYEWLYRDYPKYKIVEMKYGEPFEIKEEEIYDFPDFKLSFLGDFEEDYSKPGFAGAKEYKEFTVFCKDKRTRFNLKWSVGTGLIDPLRFECSGTVYKFNPWEDRVKVIKEENSSE